MRTQTTRTITGRVNGDGSLARPGPFTVQRVSTGIYQVTFPPDFRMISVGVTSASAYSFVTADTFVPNGCRVVTANASQAVIDNMFTLIATGAAA